MIKQKGFTLIELMVVIAIIVLLSLIAVPTYWRYQAKAKRAEAYLHLSSLYTAEKLYFADHGKYTAQLQGDDGLEWGVEGKINYSYGFPGTEGINYLRGGLTMETEAFTKYAYARDDGFVAAAVGDVDGDGKMDVLTINDKKEIMIVQNDLG